MALISGRMTYSSLYVTVFLIEPLLRELSYFVRGDGGQFMGELTLIMWRDGWQLRLVELSIGEVST